MSSDTSGDKSRVRNGRKGLETGEKRGGLKFSSDEAFSEWIVLISELFYFLLLIFVFAALSSADLRFQCGRSLCQETHQAFGVLRGCRQQVLLPDIPQAV